MKIGCEGKCFRLAQTLVMQQAVTLFGELLDTLSLSLWEAFEKYVIKVLGLIFNSIKCNLNFHARAVQ